MTKNKISEVVSKRLNKFFDEITSKFSDTLNRPDLAASYIETLLLKGKKDSKYYLENKFEETILEAIFGIKPKDSIYHYTTFEALYSILENKELHLSSIAGMNDKTETTYSDSLLKSGKVFKMTLSRIEQYNRRFIMCFTKNKDHFNHWRLYGNNGNGVSIGFKFKEPTSKKNYFALGRIVYGKYLPDLMTKLFEDIKNEIGNEFSFRRLYLWKNYFKNEDYEFETETRLLFFNRESNRYDKLEKFYKINYYKILVPYVKVPLDNDCLPIEIDEIVLGPNIPETDLNLIQLRYYLDEHKFSAIKLSQSNIKHFRG